MDRRLKARDILFGFFAPIGVEVCDDTWSACTQYMGIYVKRQG